MCFRRKKPVKTQDSMEETLSSTAENSTTADKTKLTLDDWIKACDHYAGTEDEAMILKTFADSLVKGENGLEVDYEMAFAYYERLSSIDEVAGLIGMADLDIVIGMEREDYSRCDLGVIRFYRAYLLGSDYARERLEGFAETGYGNVSSFDELVALLSSVYPPEGN